MAGLTAHTDSDLKERARLQVLKTTPFSLRPALVKDTKCVLLMPSFPSASTCAGTERALTGRAEQEVSSQYTPAIQRSQVHDSGSQSQPPTCQECSLPRALGHTAQKRTEGPSSSTSDLS